MSYSYPEYIAHGITFKTLDGKLSWHTWTDWRLVPVSRPVFAPPAAKTVYVDLPGANGQLDLTESLTGDVKFKDRIGTIEFQVENREAWNEVYSDIMDCLQGQRMRAILDDGQEYYYIGRFSVDAWNSEKNRSRIVISYDVEAYKNEMFSSLENWEWDTFNFETGVVREYKDLIVSGTLTLIIPGTRRTVVPTIVVDSEDDSGMTVWFSGTNKRYSLAEGENLIPYIAIVSGENTLKFSGTGTVSIDYRGGRL